MRPNAMRPDDTLPPNPRGELVYNEGDGGRLRGRTPCARTRKREI